MREVNLLGQNVNAYRGATHDGEICSFAELLRPVAAIDGIDRIRFTTSHPIEFTDDIIAVYEDTPELVSFLHLPVQSGSDRIPTMMKRAHTALSKARLSASCASAAGHSAQLRFHRRFPGRKPCRLRTDHEPDRRRQFRRQLQLHLFVAPGHPGCGHGRRRQRRREKQRLYILQDRINQQALQFSRRMLGTVQRILVEGTRAKA